METLSGVDGAFLNLETVARCAVSEARQLADDFLDACEEPRRSMPQLAPAPRKRLAKKIPPKPPVSKQVAAARRPTVKPGAAIKATASRKNATVAAGA